MKTNFDYLHERLEQKAGLLPPPSPSFTSLDSLYASEWSKTFETLMRNRLVMGALRYGTIAENKKKRATYDRIGSSIKRLTQYIECGNDELLVDVANLLLLEFEMGSHPLKHFSAIDDRQDHVKKL